MNILQKPILHKTEKKSKEMDNFLDIYQIPELNKDKTSDLSRPISPNEIEAVVKSPNQNKSRARWLYRRILQNFKEELTPTSLNYFSE